jgi:hypothetical protein
MSWLEKLLPPKITPTDPTERRSVPEGRSAATTTASAHGRGLTLF